MAKYNFKQFLLILCFLLSTYAVSAPIFGVGFELSIICFALVMSFAIPLVARDKNAKKPNVVVVIAIIVLAFVAWYFLGERLRNSSVNIDNATIKQSEAKSNSSDTVINAAKSKQNASAMQTAETESSAATYSDVDAGTSEIKSEEVAVMKTAYKLSDDENEMMDQIYSVSRSGNWEKFLELFSVYDGIKPEMAKMFLLVAVDNKAQSDIITYLLSSGTEIDFQVLSKAVFSDNVK